MVRAGHVVAHGLRRPIAQEDGAGVLDLAEVVHRMPHVHLQMLGRYHVHRLDGLRHVAHDDDEPLAFERLARYVGARGVR